MSGCVSGFLRLRRVRGYRAFWMVLIVMLFFLVMPLTAVLTMRTASATDAAMNRFAQLHNQVDPVLVSSIESRIRSNLDAIQSFELYVMIHQECDTLKPSDPKNRGLRAVHEKRRVRQKVCYDMGRWRQKTTIELHATDIIPPAEAARPDAHASDGGQEEWLEKEIFAESARVYEPQYDTWRNQDYAYRVFGFDVREDLHEASGVQHLADKIRITFIMRDESTLRIDLNPDNFYITDAEARDKEGHLLARHSRVKTYFKPSGEFFVLGFEQRTYRFVNGKCELVSKMIQDASCKALNESISDRLLSEDVDDSAPW